MTNSIYRLIFLWAFFTPAIVIAVQHDSAEKVHPVVPGYERFAEVEDITDAERGQLLVNELNCTACHTGQSSWPVTPKQAPILTNVGSRVWPRYVESFLLDPHSVKPGTTMPNVLAGKTDLEKKEIANSIAHFLATTGMPVNQGSSSKFVKKGERLFHSVGCVACHDPQNEEVSISTSVPLKGLDKKYTLSGLTNFIKDPLHVRPSGRMPKFNLYPNEIQSIAAYLLRDVVVDPKINYAYYEGEWETLPDFTQLEPKQSGLASGFDLELASQNDLFGIVFTGFLKVQKTQELKFRLGSDDGSRLIIDGQTVIDNDGIHGVVNKEATLKLESGMHAVRLEYFEKNGGEELQVLMFGEGIEDGVPLESFLSASENPESGSEQNKEFVLDPRKAEIGKVNFQTVGCANCHELELDGVRLTNADDLKPASLKTMKLEGGCLTGDENPVDFGLNENQVRSIVAGIKKLRNPHPGPAVLEQVTHERLMTLNCYACHDRDRIGEYGRYVVGGVIDKSGESFEVFGRKKWFTSTQAEIGDEGQHPPSLKSIGTKLNPNWMERVLTKGIKSRPYMKTRMPMFGVSNLGELANELRVVDALKDVPVVKQTETVEQVKAHGRFLAGEEALSCIKCHTFGTYNATGIQAIDLTTMTQRLNKDWFHMYMLKPSNFRRGTRMPESWPDGRTFYKDVLDGDTNKQIDALWQFLSDGRTAPKPKGLVSTKNELKAVDTPVIYRNFIEGAGPRAIGVGYPEEVNLAFDAENCCLAIIWKENFIDATRHWMGRGQGFEGPLGENVVELPRKFEFALEDSKLKPKFKGYSFDEKRRPTFMYQIGDVTIHDKFIPVVNEQNKQPTFVREVSFKSTSSKSIWFRNVEDDKVKGLVSCTAKMEKVGKSPKPGFNFKIDLSGGGAKLTQVLDW